MNVTVIMQNQDSNPLEVALASWDPSKLQVTMDKAIIGFESFIEKFFLGSFPFFLLVVAGIMIVISLMISSRRENKKRPFQNR